MIKRALDDLAIFGGNPLFPLPLHVGRPNDIDKSALLRRIGGALDRRWLTNDGPMVRELETQLADFLSVNHCVAVSNATIGIQVVAKALGLTGDVLVPSFTFIGTANALAWIGLRPVFCDVDPKSHNISPADALRKATPNTSAILGVHLWGRPCDIAELEVAASKLSAILFFDAAHAIGSTYCGQPLGRFGRAEVFSLHATKCVNALEGGVITTNDGQLAEEVRLLRNFGFVDEDRVNSLGINAKMNEFSAAMGLTSLEAYYKVRTHNRQIHEMYKDALAGLGDVDIVSASEEEDWNYHYAVIQLADQGLQWRDALHKILFFENVLARRYFSPSIHRSLPYKLTWSGRSSELQNSERLADTLLALPTGTQMTTADAGRIAALIRFAYSNREEIECRLSAAVGRHRPQMVL